MARRRSGRKKTPSRATPRTVATKVEQSFSYRRGPLPPAAELERIEQIAPGSVETLVKLLVDQSAHRRDLEQHVVRNDIWLSRFGLACAFVLGLTTIGGAVYLLSIDQSIQGFGVLVGGLAALVGVFIKGARTRSKERIAKYGVDYERNDT